MADRPPLAPGVALALGCHAELPSRLSAPLAAIIANLGCLPGGSPEITTLPDTTAKALAAALEMLASAAARRARGWVNCCRNAL